MDETHGNILLGLIIGDALGSAFDGLGRGHIRSHFKAIEDYIDPSPALKGKPDRWKKPGFYSSISQFAIMAACKGRASQGRFAEGARTIGEYQYGIFRYPDAVEKKFILRIKRPEESVPALPSVRVIAASVPLSFISASAQNENASALEVATRAIGYVREFTHDASTAAVAASLAWLMRSLIAERPRPADFVQICRACNETLIKTANSDPGPIFSKGLNPDALVRELDEMNGILSEITPSESMSESEARICKRVNTRMKTPITRATVNMPLALVPYALAIGTAHRDDPDALFLAAMEGGASGALTSLSAALRVAAYGPAVLPPALVRNLSNRKKIMSIIGSLKNGVIPEAAMENFIQGEAALTRKELEELRAKQKHVKKKPTNEMSRTEKETRLSHYVVESWTKLDKAKWKKERKKIDKKHPH